MFARYIHFVCESSAHYMASIRSRRRGETHVLHTSAVRKLETENNLKITLFSRDFVFVCVCKGKETNKIHTCSGGNYSKFKYTIFFWQTSSRRWYSTHRWLGRPSGLAILFLDRRPAISLRDCVAVTTQFVVVY